MSFAPGALVRARGREWVVLPVSRQNEDLLILRPLAGTEDETTGIYLPLEPDVEAATFPLPDPDRELGNHRSASLLHDAIRLGFRSSAGPFRSMGRIGVEPRPYQLVPLLMALRLEPVRLLIADDVGVGKTVEACLIARELLDRAEIHRLAVLCPPHLADQWQRALWEQFHIDAKTVLPGTAGRLEREAGLSAHDSLFEHYPFVVVSLDYIKGEKRRHEFVRTCPEFVIVDEAHTCAPAGLGRNAQRRHALVQELSADPKRHLVLVTATPHSGKEENFRALLGLLDREFAELPENLAGEAHRAHRERLAQHFIQRRRGDIRAYLDTETSFPERVVEEYQYQLSPEYRSLFDDVLAYCRESVQAEETDERRQRVRWWSALALLRSLGSSPAAAAATLRNRAAGVDASSPGEADELGRRTVLDLDEESAEAADAAPGAQPNEGAESSSSEPERLERLAKAVDKLRGKLDRKLQGAVSLTKDLLKQGLSPILFCRFIPTAEYLAEALRETLGNKVVVEAISGNLAPEEREARVDALGENVSRVLVCTDCLSEGINLQHYFDAVVHYDLSWNPTRHEQREGRVDRYGQSTPSVKTVTYYGQDNPIDGIVLSVLLRKHTAIRQQLGISVPVPTDSNAVMEAVFESLLLTGKEQKHDQLSLDFAEPHRKQIDLQWDTAADREKQSRTIFAQRAIKVEDVAREVEAAREAVGGHKDVKQFVVGALESLGARVHDSKRASRFRVDGLSAAAKDSIEIEGDEFQGVFEEPVAAGAVLLSRTHPLVSGLASYIWNLALDSNQDSPASRCATIRTDAVSTRTTAFLLRLRYQIETQTSDGTTRPLLAEEAAVVGFSGSPTSPTWLPGKAAASLLHSNPAGNIAPELARVRLREVNEHFEVLLGHIEQLAKRRADALLEAHRRVRQAARQRIRALRVEPHLPADVLGVFVYLPVPGGKA